MMEENWVCAFFSNFWRSPWMITSQWGKVIIKNVKKRNWNFYTKRQHKIQLIFRQNFLPNYSRNVPNTSKWRLMRLIKKNISIALHVVYFWTLQPIGIIFLIDVNTTIFREFLTQLLKKCTKYVHLKKMKIDEIDQKNKIKIKDWCLKIILNVAIMAFYINFCPI